MAYIKQNFKNGETLRAGQLNHIEDGISQTDDAISTIENEKKLYWHSLTISFSFLAQGYPYVAFVTILNNSSSEITKNDIKNMLNSNHNAHLVITNYYVDASPEPDINLLFFKYGTDESASVVYKQSSSSVPMAQNISYSVDSFTVQDSVDRIL